jgi:NTP pyrophosphatase (non-canonical NTP hydrolase)
MQINETVKKAHQTAVDKGFWDKPEWNLGEKLMLITSELGEALEADRTGRYANKDLFSLFLEGNGDAIVNEESYVENFKKHMKDSFEDEMADAVIRIFDLAGKMNVDLEYHIRHKMQFNSTRDKLHGKKY